MTSALTVIADVEAAEFAESEPEVESGVGPAVEFDSNNS